MTALLPFQLQIPKRNAVCTLCEELLRDGMPYYSLLSENGELRQDFCASCWKQFSQTEEGKKALRYWKSKVPLKKAKVFLPKTRDAHIFALLREMLEEEPCAKEIEEERFILSIYLARRRLIALRKEERQQDLYFQLYEVLETEELFSIKKINLSKIEIEAVQARIAQKLQ